MEREREGKIVSTVTQGNDGVSARQTPHSASAQNPFALQMVEPEIPEGARKYSSGSTLHSLQPGD